MAQEQIQLESAVKELSSPDAKTRTTAAKALFSAGLREYTHLRKDVLASDESWRALLGALADPEVKVVENAAGAVAQVIARYRSDGAAFEPLRRLLAHKSKDIRVYAVRGLSFLENPARWDALIPLLDDKTEPVRKEVVKAIGRHSRELTPAGRERAIASMERYVGSAGAELKMLTENALRGLKILSEG